MNLSISSNFRNLSSRPTSSIIHCFVHSALLLPVLLFFKSLVASCAISTVTSVIPLSLLMVSLLLLVVHHSLSVVCLSFFVATLSLAAVFPLHILLPSPSLLVLSLIFLVLLLVVSVSISFAISELFYKYPFVHALFHPGQQFIQHFRPSSSIYFAFVVLNLAFRYLMQLSLGYTRLTVIQLNNA